MLINPENLSDFRSAKPVLFDLLMIVKDDEVRREELMVLVQGYSPFELLDGFLRNEALELLKQAE